MYRTARSFYERHTLSSEVLEAVVKKKTPKAISTKAIGQKKIQQEDSNMRDLTTDEILDRRQCVDGKTSILGWLAMIWDDNPSPVRRSESFTTQQGVLTVLKVLQHRKIECETVTHT